MRNLKEQFLLDPDICYLNFGSFGACPKPIFDDYIQWQYLLEREPVQFIAVDGPQYLVRSREALAQYLGCNTNDLVLVTNPSYAVNIIAKSFPLGKGDEVLTTDIEYGACDKTWNYYCAKSGATYRRHPVKFPYTSKAEFVEDFFTAVNENTKLIFISHLTSSTALILPVEEICRKARAMGIMTFIDGAHAPGQLALDLKNLDADIYTGACHKWMMTPKGCSFLYVRPDWQALFDPLIVSWGFDAAIPGPSRFIDYHQGQGTRDFSAMLTIPAAIRFMDENHWPDVAARCRQLVIDQAERFCNLLKAEPLSTLHSDFIAQLYSIRIRSSQPEKLQRLLFEKYKIEIPVMRHDDKVFIRFSINAFNSSIDLDKLYAALEEIIRSDQSLLVV